MNNDVKKVCICSFCGNPMRNPEAEDLGKKYFPGDDKE